MRKGMLIFSMVLLGLLISQARVTAQETYFNVGKLKVLPALTLDGEYNDNIFLASGINNTDERVVSDYLLHVKPYLFFDYEFEGRGYLSFGYDGDIAFYSDNSESDWRRHQVTFDFDYKAPAGVIVGFNNYYVDTTDPYSAANQFALGVPQVKRWSDTLGSKLGYDFGNKLKVLGFFNFYKQEYAAVGDFSQNYDDNELGAGAELRVSPKTWGFLRYHYGERDFNTHPAGTRSNETNDADSSWDRVNVGLNWDPTAKVGGELNFGYLWRDYENRFDVNGNPYQNKDTWIARTYLTYQAGANTGLGMTLNRGLLDRASTSKEYFEDTGVGLTVDHIFMTKFLLSVGGIYSNNDYNSGRDDDNYRANAGLDYKINDWLSTGAKYTYWKRDSNQPAQEFTQNRVLLTVSGNLYTK
ncbi:outer membrane beta-barrel protein [Thermodesulfobacteriota bacterium]